MRQTTYTGGPAILSCWKDIARYLGKGVRTVQRWEREFALPVRRPKGADRKSAVAADPRDLDAWLATRWSLRTQDQDSDATKNEAVASEINRGIETARLLRERHGTLVRELGVAMQMVSQNCQRLAKGEPTMSMRLGTFSRPPMSEFSKAGFLLALNDPLQHPATKDSGSGNGRAPVSQSRPS